jgi:cytochrome c oxidase assembly protein subunit 15
MVLLYFKAQKFTLSTQQKRGLNGLVLVVLLQFTLGVLTLLYGVPLWLGLIHQVVAFFLLATMTFTLHRLSK